MRKLKCLANCFSSPATVLECNARAWVHFCPHPRGCRARPCSRLLPGRWRGGVPNGSMRTSTHKDDKTPLRGGTRSEHPNLERPRQPLQAPGLLSHCTFYLVLPPARGFGPLGNLTALRTEIRCFFFHSCFVLVCFLKL